MRRIIGACACVVWMVGFNGFAPVARGDDSGSLEIIEAKWGPAGKGRDVTALVAGMVRDGRLDLKVSADTLGEKPGKKGPPPYLTITYKLKGAQKTERFRAGQDVWISPVSREDVALAAKAAQMRQEQPHGLLLVSAKYGTGNRWNDVTDELRGLVWDDSLTVPSGDDAFGNPAPGSSGKRLIVAYDDGNGLQKKEIGEGATLQIGPKVVPVLPRGGKLINLRVRLDQLRKEYPQGIVVLDALFGEGNRWKDVTALLQGAASGDSLTVPVGTDVFGDPAPGQAGKILKVWYHDGKDFKFEQAGEGVTLQVGPRRTAVAAQGGGLLNIDRRVAELRKEHPRGLVIVDARYGVANRWMDVTDKVQERVKGADLSIPVGTPTFGDPLAGQAGKRLITTYHDGQKVVTVETPEGSTLTINARTTSVVDAGGQLMTMPERVEALRKVYGDGLLILDAQYGSGNQWGDVREKIQQRVVNNALSVDVGDGWGDPAPGSVKEVRVTYWDGRQVKNISLQGGRLELRGVKPEPLAGLPPLPKYVPAGKPLSHAFGRRGTFELVSGPRGASLSRDGNLTWTPAPDQAGPVEFQIAITAAGKKFYEVQRVEVVAGELARGASGAAGLDALMRLDLGNTPCGYFPGLGWKTGLVLRRAELIVLNGDGTTVKRRATTAKEYSKIIERPGYFLAVAKDAKALDLLDKATLKPTRTIKLAYHGLSDLAAHPTRPVSYVAVEDPAEDSPRWRVVVVDEASGDVREPQNVVGTWLAVDPAGARLYTGYKDLYRKGTHYFLNPDGRLWDTPTYGNIDILMTYDLADATHPKLREYKVPAGANGSGLRLSPDGKRLTYLSFTGYPANSGAIPAWDPADLEKKPVAYECRGKAAAVKMNYHPVLPLVAVPGNDGPVFFNRETGDEEPVRARVPSGTLDGTTLNDVYFSPDGANAILQCERGGTWWLYKVPLTLTTAEKEMLKRGVPPPAPRQAPPRPQRPGDRA